MGGGKLWVIEAKLWNPNISLKEIKTLWFKAKEIIKNLVNPSELEIEVSVNIFNKGIEKVGEFFQKFLIFRQIQPTDEELDILDEAFDEASWAFSFLAKDPNICSPENNEGWQRKIKENKQIISEERNKRKQIKDLQSQINSLQNQSNGGIDNAAEINDLKRKIKELENNKSSSPFVPDFDPQQSVPKLPKSDSNYLVPFFLGFGMCLVFFLVIKSLRKTK